MPFFIFIIFFRSFFFPLMTKFFFPFVIFHFFFFFSGHKYSYTANDSPHPHDAVALGLMTLRYDPPSSVT
ncbi:MAG TPA: hypothetical protein DCM04_02580 [Saprospirales bacterium]|nr:hypothetical protein [Saprospirales bacterium]